MRFFRKTLDKYTIVQYITSEHNITITMSKLHIKVNNFYASVETELNPGLSDKDFAISNGTVIIGLSPGLKSPRQVPSGVSEAYAREKLPGLIIIRGDIDRYIDQSRKLAEEFSEIAFTVSEIRPGEFCLDITRCPLERMSRLKREEKLTDIMRGRVFRAGQGENRFIAETAARCAGNNKIKCIAAGEETSFMSSLPVEKMPFLQEKIPALQELGINTIGDLVKIPKPVLQQIFGSSTTYILRLCSGVVPDNYDSAVAIKPSRLWRFIRFKKVTERPEREIIKAVSSLTMELFTGDLKASGMMLGLKYADDVSVAKGIKLVSTRDEVELAKAVTCLLEMLWQRRTRLDSARVELNVIPDNRQISFLDNNKRENISQSVDQVRRIYGMGAVKYALSMG